MLSKDYAQPTKVKLVQEWMGNSEGREMRLLRPTASYLVNRGVAEYLEEDFPILPSTSNVTYETPERKKSFVRAK